MARGNQLCFTCSGRYRLSEWYKHKCPVGVKE